MLVAHEDAPHHVVALPDHPNLRRRLHEIEALPPGPTLLQAAGWPRERIARSTRPRLAFDVHFNIGMLREGSRSKLYRPAACAEGASRRLPALRPKRPGRDPRPFDQAPELGPNDLGLDF